MPETFALVDPATEDEIHVVGMADVDQIDGTVEGALTAQVRWAALSPAERAARMRHFADLVEQHAEELARLEVRNSGHPITSARWEARHVADVLRYYAGAPERLLGAQIPVAGGIDVTFHEPLGVVAVIVPWNFPMTIAAWGFAPALAAGNAVVLKPAEWTPLTALRLGELADLALTPGVLVVQPGFGPIAGGRLVEHPDVAKVVFTGSTVTGRRIAERCGALLKPVTLELGGKSANIVFADADLDAAASAAPGAVFDNAGQDCCARSRILVERSVLGPFLERLEVAVRAWRVGDPADEDTQMGPLVSAEHRAKVESYVDGSTPVAFRGSAPTGPGFWFAPAVLLPDRADDRVLTEEIFGPVVAVQPFDGEAEAIRLANGTEYGLSGSIWTGDLGRGIRVARAVRSGALSVNSNSSVRYTTPFGGMKSSGLGRELGPDAPLAFTQTKNVFFAEGTA